MIKIIATMFLCHFIADFLLQSREMAQQKSSKIRVLWDHICIQYVVLCIGLLYAGVDFATSAKICLFNSLIHGVIDWYIWRCYKWSVAHRIEWDYAHPLTVCNDGPWKYWEDHLFYTTIGFDQLLHGLTLIGCAGLFL